ncbi:MAG: ABC transporter permease [Bdellovibrionales bacterium]|nr:ABC transporter permease [Bdellovibrionales bacterium]
MNEVIQQVTKDNFLAHFLKFKIKQFLIFMSGIYMLFMDCVREFFKSKTQWPLVWEQVYQTGIKSLPLIFITTLSIGMVMALQFGISLEKFGGKIYVPKVVSLSIVRELGPVFASMMIAARVGAGITSEIGSMMVTEQISAIRALGTSPIQKIILPRVLGTLIALPTLAILSNVFGVTGGLIVGTTELGLDPSFYLQKAYTTITNSDYFSGIAKTVFFSFMVSITACYYGLKVKGGTKDVGYATTKSVVTSSIGIMIGDYFLTKLFWIVEQWLS